MKDSAGLPAERGRQTRPTTPRAVVMPNVAVRPTARSPAARGMPGERAVFGRRQRWALLAAFALLVIFRLPHAWAHGRFLDEEATVFFAYAWHRPWLDALFRPFAGYWNLGANATTVLAVTLVKHGVVPLERAPYLTMTMALAVQLLPAALVLTARASWLAARPAVIATLLVIAIAPSTEEVFCNVLHIQFHLSLCVALILAVDVPKRRDVSVGYGILLFLAPLCGPSAIVILPLFALRGLVDRDRARLWQMAAFAAGAAVQLLLFYGPSPMRGHLVDPGTIAAMMFVRLIALPAVNFGPANDIGTAIYHSWVAGGTGWWWSAMVAVLLFGILLLLAVRRRDAAIWMVLSSLSIAVTSFGFGMVIIDPFDRFSVGAGERYNFLPLVLLGLTLVALAMRDQRWTRRAAILLCTIFLVNGVIGCLARPVRAFKQGPSWADEVAVWRRDHRHPLAVWPSPWAADLSDETHPCSPVGADPALSTDPRFCESGWVAAFHRQPLAHH